MPASHPALPPTLSTGLMVVLLIVVAGQLVFWDAMTALIGTYGVLFVLLIAFAGLAVLLRSRQRAR